MNGIDLTHLLGSLSNFSIGFCCCWPIVLVGGVGAWGARFKQSRHHS